MNSVQEMQKCVPNSFIIALKVPKSLVIIRQSLKLKVGVFQQAASSSNRSD